MDKKLFSILLFINLLLVLVLYSTQVSAVGIAGAVYEKLFFKPGLEKTYTYIVNSNTDKVMNHDLFVNGPLNQYFTLSTNVLRNLAPGDTASFSIYMKLPQELAPGEYINYICAAENKTRGAATEEGASIGSRAIVCAVISIFSPYPGKHIDFELKAANVSKTDNATFMLEVINQGTEAVNVKGVIEIYNPKVEAGAEKKIVTLYTEEKIIETGEKVTLKAELNVSDFEIGEYRAKATVFFDGNQTTKEKLFRVGDLYMEVMDFTKEVSQDKLNPISVKAESKWNGPIKNVYATLEITDLERNVVVANINSAPTDFLPWESKSLVAYWDTTGFESGEYGLKITLNYENKVTIKEGTINIKFGEGKILSFTTLLLLILIVVVIILILLIIKLMKRTRSQVKPKQVRLRKRGKI
ncbi:MAG: hypothetical protein ACPLXC_03265 [Candidatus Pacearchaeota archaeon]